MSAKKDMVVDWIRAHKDMSNSASAKLFVKKYPHEFKDFHACRIYISSIRTPKRSSYTKSHGTINPVPDLIRTKEERDSWRTKLPSPDPEEFKTWVLPTTSKRWLYLADIHSPYFDKDAIFAAVEKGKDEGCDGLFLNGDISDFYQLSNFVKDPRQRSFPEEADLAKELFDVIQKTLKPKTTVWKLGNHEERLERFVMLRTPELLGLPGMTIQSIFGCKERGITIIPPGDPVQHKGLTTVHGHEFGGGFVAPVNPARGMFLRAMVCTVSAHQHRSSEHTETTATGSTITCWSLGCLCGLHPKYRSFNKWNHGCGILSTGEGKTWHFRNYRIMEGKVV